MFTPICAKIKHLKAAVNNTRVKHITRGNKIYKDKIVFSSDRC